MSKVKVKSAHVIAEELRECTNPEELAKAAQETKSLLILQVIGANEHTPPEILLKLATHHDEDVRCEVASNVNLPPEARGILLKDSCQFVRNALSSKTYEIRRAHQRVVTETTDEEPPSSEPLQ